MHVQYFDEVIDIADAWRGEDHTQRPVRALLISRLRGGLLVCLLLAKYGVCARREDAESTEERGITSACRRTLHIVEIASP